MMNIVIKSSRAEINPPYSIDILIDCKNEKGLKTSIIQQAGLSKREIENYYYNILPSFSGSDIDSFFKMVMMILEMEAKEEGRAEGRAEGRSKGVIAERKRVALNMLRESGTAISFISKITGFSEDEVLDLARENGEWKSGLHERFRFDETDMMSFCYFDQNTISE